MSEKMPAELEPFRKDFERAEKKVSGEIQPGLRGVVLAVLIVALLGSFALPHVGAANGWEVISGSASAQKEAIAFTSEIFLWIALIFGGLLGILTLVTRRWALAWVVSAGTTIGIVFGVLAIWSRQTTSQKLAGPDSSKESLEGAAHLAGPGIGLIVMLILMVVLTYMWLRVVWTKTSLQFAAEQERRQHASDDDDELYNQSRLGRPDRPRE
ncbi:Rv2732c family membrane protein [Tomitella biformata]|uniref:Rv2732c family membrane protein n=1 Tax=Tomitella biformata TaxID=630403 RepID=UPI00046462F3|nr:hypothetical protein [Tomitella biformata]